MKNRQFFFVALVFLFIFTSLHPNKTSADWAYPFVVWDGYVYAISDEFVEEIEGEIGRVTKYSDREGTYSGNFSNVYKKGTNYYSIKGVSTDEAIAVEDEEGKHKRAVREGKYEGNKYSLGFPIMIAFIALLSMWILLVYYKRRKLMEIHFTVNF